MRVMIVLVAALFGFVASPAVSYAHAQSARELVAQSEGLGSRAGRNGIRKISVDFKNASLREVLKVIAERSGEELLYSTDDILTTSRVTYQGTSITAEEALIHVLKGANLRIERLRDGGIKLVRVTQGARNTQGVITGKVTDAKSGKSIQWALVSVNSDATGVKTSEDGLYRLTVATSGMYTVSVRLVGYAKQTRVVTVGEGTIATADFKLEPSANVLDQVIVTGTVVQTELKAIPNAITVVTAKQIEERGITKIDQLFRGDIPGLFAQNQGSGALLDEVTMFSRGATALSTSSAGTSNGTNPIKTYIDGIEMADPKYLSQIDPKSIERIEILTGPQASTIYGSNAINGVMQIFTKRGSTSRPQLTLSFLSGWVENNFSSARTPQHDYSAQLSGIEGNLSYNAGGSWNYMGPWTPAKQTARTGGFGGARLDLPTPAGKVTADLTLRRSITQNLQRGDAVQTLTAYGQTGLIKYFSFTTGLIQPTTHTLTGQALGLTLTYAPTSWWSHELGMGSDVSDAETRTTARGYKDRSDTALSLFQSHTDRRSFRYTTTARISITSLAQATVTAGADAWQNLATSLSNFSTQTLTGPLTGTDISISRHPGHNAGGFLQSQLGITDRLFLTYGLRAEWNPNFGDEAQPNFAPRYGVAYTHELGSITAKLRGSYGRSTRPPQPALKVAQTIAEWASSSWSSFFKPLIEPYYGIFDNQLANPELAPEYQQGGEGGLELYFGTRGSLVVTRYNQTVDGLIAQPVADSVRTLVPCNAFSPTCTSNSLDADGYGYYQQYQYLNIGSIRNQGWELQGSVNVGPITTRGTYSWTKSRSLGMNPKYRAQFSPTLYPQYQPGATFWYLPEHTWALGVTYALAKSSVSLNVTGTGQTTNAQDDFYLRSLNPNIRLAQNRLNMNSGQGYINFNTGYALADLMASHRFAPQVEGVLQMQNLADSYTNDLSAGYASLGRQVRLGVRVRIQ